MTMFIPSPQLTTVAPLVSKDKGSFGNRINCAGAQLGNAVATTAGVAGTVLVADTLVSNSAKIKTFADKVAQKLSGVKLPQFVKTGIKKGATILEKSLNALKGTKVGKYVADQINKATPFIKTFVTKAITAVQKAVSMFNKLPKGGKIALVGTLAMIVLNGIYKSGQIDQKYTDRAKMEKNLV